MAVFFNGRLYTTPVTASQIEDSGLRNRNLAVGNVVGYLGSSGGGKPNTELRFGSPSEARQVLRSGPLLDAVERAFSPSPDTGSPATVVAIRVDPATQSSLMLQASAADVIQLTSEDYGLHTETIKIKVEDGTNQGKKLTTQVGDDYYSRDDVYRHALSVEYTGAEVTAVMTIDNTSVTLEAPAATPVATIDLNSYDTVQKLVDRINTVTDFTALVLDGNGEKPALNGLDSVADQDVKSAAYTVTAHLQACVDWFNGLGEGFVTAVRQAGAGAAPDNVDWTYLAGGSNGTITNQEWSDAFTTLQGAGIRHVSPLSADESIHAMADAHVAFMSNVARKERRSFVGGAVGQTLDEAIAAAKALNSDRSAQCYPGYYDFNAAGELTLYPSYMTAALMAAGFAGVNPGTALTNKALNVRGLEVQLRNPTDTDQAIDGGVLCVEDTEQGYKVVKSVSTWLVNDNYNRVEISTGIAGDFVARTVREAVDGVRGDKGSPRSLAEAFSRADTALRELSRPEPNGPGVLVGDEENPAFKELKVNLEGDVLRVEFQANLVVPINYGLIVIYAQAYSGTAAA